MLDKTTKEVKKLTPKKISDSYFEEIDTINGNYIIHSYKNKKLIYPNPFSTVVSKAIDLLSEKFSEEGLSLLYWEDMHPTIDFNTGEFVKKPIYRIHIKKNNTLLISIFFDIHEIASFVMNEDYFEIYPVYDGGIERYYSDEIDELMISVYKNLVNNYKRISGEVENV